MNTILIALLIAGITNTKLLFLVTAEDIRISEADGNCLFKNCNYRVSLNAEEPDDNIDFIFTKIEALNGEKGAVSFEARSAPGFYLRVRDDTTIWLDKYETSEKFVYEASFRLVQGS